MKVVRRLLLLALICAVTASCSTLAVAAATVNGQRITQDDVEQALKQLTADPAFGQALRQDPNVARGDGRRQVLTQLIYSAVADQQGKKLGIAVTPQQEDNLMSQAAQGQGLSVAQFLRAQNLTLAQAHDIAHRLVLDSTLQERVLNGNGVSAERIKQAYDANKEAFAEAHLMRITVQSSNDVRDVLQKLGTGTDFATLAKQKSLDQLAPTGGDMGFVLLSRLSPQEQDAVNRAKTGGFTDPIPSQSAFVVLKVVERRTEPLSEATAEIRSGLEQQQRTQDYQNWLRARVRAAHVVVNPQYGRFDRAQAAVVRSSTSLPS